VDDPQVRQPDSTRARQVLGWEPEVELEEGLIRILAEDSIGVATQPGQHPARLA
jgi:nucleoside-diphosphate-sugar epimerase